MSRQNMENKKLVRAYYDAVQGATPETIGTIVSTYFSEDTVFDCSHPINRLEGREAVVEEFWKPFLRSFPDAVKRPYIFMGGKSIRWDEDERLKDGDWVCASGYYEATFARDYCDIPASGGIVFIRFCEYSLVKEGKIVLTRTIIDLLDLMRQVGISFFKARGLETFIPGPYTFDGIMMGEYDEATGAASIQLIEDMCYKGLHSYAEKGLGGMGLERYFKEDFTWYGPCGIGVCKGIAGFQKYHQAPWLEAFPDRRNANWFASVGENNYASVGGWPSMYQTHTGNGWLGIPATGAKMDVRCIDWWRVEDGKIAENWVHLDMPHMFLQMGIDVFKYLREGTYFFRR